MKKNSNKEERNNKRKRDKNGEVKFDNQKHVRKFFISESENQFANTK